MSSSIPESTESLQLVALSDRQDLYPGSRTNQELIIASTGDLILGVAVGYDQGWPASDHGDEVPQPSYFDYSPTMMTAFPVCVELGSQSLSPPHEASFARLPVVPVHTNTSQTQPCGMGEHVIIQGTRDDRKRSNTPRRRVRPNCTGCNRDFVRVQEFKRHLKDVHEPRRQCPFCSYTWTRPYKIKGHVIASHHGKFTAEELIDFKALCGQDIVAFLPVLT
jgi:hypothetical protein